MFSYIVLHYKNMEETEECLKHLKKIITNKDSIIVVDNNTLNDKDENIIKKYTKDIIKLDRNYGFAKANNIGIKYAKGKYNSSYYVVLNNDVYISQNEFQDIVDDDYKKYHFDMLGSSIDSPTKESVNPFPAFKGRDSVLKEINRCNKLIRIYDSEFLYLLLQIYLKVKRLLKPVASNENGKNLEKDVALHGCCIIFSKKYIGKYEYPFYNETFLFHEEEFLYQRVIKDKLVSIYDPKLNVFHAEGSSIKKENKNKRKSLLFREKKRLESLKLLLESL